MTEQNAPIAAADRKADHLRINLREDVQARGITNGFEHLRLEHAALPELHADAIDTSTTIFGKRLRSPLLISSMTGGVTEGGAMNGRLARVAQSAGIALGVGSQRVALADPARTSTFAVRRFAPDVLLFANLGAVQLNHGLGVEDCRRAVEMIEADALILHLNPLQEILQPEGNHDFSGLASKIAAVCRALPVPVVVKEVGWGISAGIARTLADAGVAAIDVAGAGGTSWSEVEKHRALTARQRRVAEAFAGWGIPTAEALREVTRAVPGLPVFASGGITNGIEVTKALALGASLAAFAGTVLRAAAMSEETALAFVEEITEVLRVAMFATGCATIAELRRKRPIREIR